MRISDWSSDACSSDLAGRCRSADQAFADVIRLMPDNDKARVGQAVARVAQGERAGARAALAEVRNAPADDYGLALALAGDTARAVDALEPAARGMRRSQERRVGTECVSQFSSR